MTYRTARWLILPVAAMSLCACGINSVPTKEEAAKAKWANVEAAYQRRADLIPNLVESVKGFADQEKSVLEGVTKARQAVTQINILSDILTNPEAMKKFQEAQNSLGGALRQLLVVSERYPEVKSGENFRKLQDEIAGTENRIAISRRDYINSVRVYNTELTTIPGRWWKAFMYPGSNMMATFDVPVEEQKAPKVDFSTPKKS